MGISHFVLNWVCTMFLIQSEQNSKMIQSSEQNTKMIQNSEHNGKNIWIAQKKRPFCSLDLSKLVICSLLVFSVRLDVA